MIEHFLNAVGASQPPERYGESFGAAKGNTAGGLLADSRSLVKGEGLRIATWARPPRLTRGATGVSLWAAPGHGKAARRGRLGDGSNRSVRSRLRTSRRTLPCRSLGQERACRAGYEVVKVKRHRLLRAKIAEDRLNN